MATNPAALARAWAAYQSGDPAWAAQIYGEELRTNPGDADTWCLLGIVQRAAGDPVQAAASYREALRLRPGFVEAWNNLGNALVAQNLLDEAVAAFEQALSLRPNHVEAHNNLGAARRHQGKWAEAAVHYRYALQLRPDYPEAHNNLGDALQGMGRLEEAVASYQEALRLRPGYAEAHTNLGNALVKLGRTDEAIAHHREALRLRPGYVEARSNLGNALAAQRRYDQAEAAYREALRTRPDYAQGHYNLGIALAEQGRLAEARECYHRALQRKPDYADALGNLATALLAEGKPHEAIAVFEQVLQRNPRSAEVHMARALAYLLMGDWERGWPEYEWRWQCPEFGGPPYPQPRWDGTPLDGRTILLHAEQGLGDTLLAVRYARLVRERGGRTLLACPRALRPLLARTPGIDQLVEQGTTLPSFDCYVPLLSLPGIFRTTPETVPAGVPYLEADPALVEQWRAELASVEGLRIGIVWQGNPQFKGDRLRSIPLQQFAPLAAVEGVRLIGLQKGFGSEQMRQVSFPVLDLSERLDTTTGPFLDTAAVMRNLDLIITSDTAIAHLAGGLGVPVWTALASSPHWVWLLERAECPWYPSMRLFRQRKWGDWGEVFERMAAELRRAGGKQSDRERETS